MFIHGGVYLACVFVFLHVGAFIYSCACLYLCGSLFCVPLSSHICIVYVLLLHVIYIPLVCICVSMFVHASVCVHAFCICTCIFVHLCGFMYVILPAYVCFYVCTCMHVHDFAFMCMHIYVYANACLYIYVYIYLHALISM